VCFIVVCFLSLYNVHLEKNLIFIEFVLFLLSLLFKISVAVCAVLHQQLFSIKTFKHVILIVVDSCEHSQL